MSLPVLRTPDFVHAPRFQLWTDALCFRQMARDAPNNYLTSMCVRYAVLSAWTTLEMACLDALGAARLGTDFKRGLNDELAKQGKVAADFGQGIWQQLATKTLSRRNLYAHRGVTLTDRFPPVEHAEDAIGQVRACVRDIYARLGRPTPTWIENDGSAGWPRGGSGFVGTPTVIRQSADQNDPGTVKIALLAPSGVEQPIEYLRSETPEADILAMVEDVLGNLNTPFVGIRVYRGSTMIYGESIEVRG